MAEGITKSFGGELALDAVDLAVPTGSVLALLGPNGAGKSTLVRILATLVAADAGTATVAGHDVRRQPDAVKRSISLTGQHTAVDEVLTGRENLEMMGELRHLPRGMARRRATELLGAFGLLDAGDRRVGTYSGGMKRRLDLAISMVERPQLMFLDEPTTGLDPRSREQLWATVRRIVGEGVTVLLTTQYLEEADQLADQVAMLDHGRIVARGTPDELKASVGAEIVRLQFADAASYEAARREHEGAQGHDRPNTLEVSTDGSAQQLLEVLERLRRAGMPVVKVSTHRPSLDDAFLALTAAGATDDHATEMAA